MIPKPIESINKTDIEALISNATPEGRQIEFKLQLPKNTDKDKKEFLADISSFANATGGDLLYGIDEQRDAQGQPTGIPTSAIGLRNINTDAELLRLENIIRDGIQPRISNLTIRAIPDFTQGPAILIRVNKSWLAPHMVTYQNTSRFYTRTSAGKHQLDITEIRTAFALSESLPKRVQNFRDERISRIISQDTSIPMGPDAKTILHLLPLSALDGQSHLDPIQVENKQIYLKPLSSSAWDHRYNADGLLIYAGRPRTEAQPTYTQLFRTAAIEAVESRMLHDERDGRKYIPNIRFERELIETTWLYLKAYSAMEIPPPAFLMVTLTGVKDFTMAVDPRLYGMSEGRYAIDRDTLFLPDILIEDFTAKPDQILKPAFDVLWQAAGWPGSHNYDKDGNWSAQR